MTVYNFDQPIERCGSDSIKWHHYDPDVLPLWVADMDFASPEPVIRALGQRVQHGVFGYGWEPAELRPVIVEHLLRRYNWKVSPEALVFVPGVVTGFNLATHAVTSPGDSVLAQTPVYYPILYAPGNAGCTLQEMQLVQTREGLYEIDFEALEAAITERTRIFILCNPHNPVGRVFHHEELARMAEICLKRDIVICSDEIHCDLVFEGSRHIPIASLDPQIAQHTITLMAPSKTYNVAGLHASLAIIPDQGLRQRFEAARAGLVPRLGIMGFAAMLAAYRDGQSWLDQVLSYLQANRDFLFDYVRTHLHGIHMSRPEGTYLAWLDCRELAATDPDDGSSLTPHGFFHDRAGVALNDGATFGRGGKGFVRLNFGCPRGTLVKALQQMKQALIL
jgi:cystathionine beta-lyase